MRSRTWAAAISTWGAHAVSTVIVPRVAFTAPEYQVDGTIRPAGYVFEGAPGDGWMIHREGRRHLELGAGYRLVRVRHCGVCATDLARRYLPFPLPQVTGHEVVGDDDGRLVVVEINASCTARGLVPCVHCAAGMPTHCPERRVLGIHDLPGGFGPWLLAPVHGVLPVPPSVSPLAATFVEPFAAAWHAVERIAPNAGDRVLVLGPGRLGALVVAALAAWRARRGVALEILAAGRGARSRERATRLGADATFVPEAAPPADVVVDATGSPDGFERAVALARREVHIKTTTGRPALGLAHVTELVVDELTIAPLEGAPPTGGVVVRTDAEIDAAIRPFPSEERSRTGPRGTIFVADVRQPRTRLLAALLDRRLRITTSRCGDFRPALSVLAAEGLGERLANEMVVGVLPATALAEAFARAAAGGSKMVVRQADVHV